MGVGGGGAWGLVACAQTNGPTYIHIYMYMHVYTYVCMYVCVYVCMCVWGPGPQGKSGLVPRGGGLGPMAQGGVVGGRCGPARGGWRGG